MKLNETKVLKALVMAKRMLQETLVTSIHEAASEAPELARVRLNLREREALLRDLRRFAEVDA